MVPEDDQTSVQHRGKIEKPICKLHHESKIDLTVKGLAVTPPSVLIIEHLLVFQLNIKNFVP